MFPRRMGWSFEQYAVEGGVRGAVHVLGAQEFAHVRGAGRFQE